MNAGREGKTMRDIAFERIKAAIVNGDWEGGTFLTEKWLGEWLQMSKTPIRSALDRLEMMGLVNISHSQGAYVREVSLKKILEIYELRMALETYAAKALTGNVDASFLAAMDAQLSQQAEAAQRENIREYVELDRRFHEMIVAGLDNEEYAEAMSRMQDKFILAVRTTFFKNRSRLWSSWEEHRRIRDALAGNDPEATVELVARHIEYVKKVMF